MPTRTIADFIREEIAIAIYCRNLDCRHSATADLDVLAAKLGPDRDLYSRPPRWKCSRCGSPAEIRLSPPSSPADLADRRAARERRRAGTESRRPD